jgi:hypothetical protein
MVRYLFILLVFFSNLTFSQTKVEILKKDINEKKIIRKINFYKKWYWITFRISKGENINWNMKDTKIVFYPLFKYTCPIDSSIYRKNLFDFLVYDKKEMFKDYGYGENIVKDGKYHGSISVRNRNPGITANKRFWNDTLNEYIYNTINSKEPEYVFSIKGIGIVFLKNDELFVVNVINGGYVEIIKMEEYIRRISLINLYRVYNPLSKREYKRLYGEKYKNAR